MKLRLITGALAFALSIFTYTGAWSQCGGILEPGFAFLSSSRGCAPFTVQIQTIYLASVPGTEYYLDWGDGTPEETYVQVGPTGVSVSHTYPNSPVTCGYDVIIDASNACNPRGSVVPIQTQVIVWTNDIISIDPAEFRVCEGFAATMNFTDNSAWNCFPRATRENSDPRWIQWQYGTGPAGNQVAGVLVNGVGPGAFPYLDPGAGRNPIYPVAAPGEVSLSITVPATAPADVGKEFQITMRNWNQCNAYDNNILDGNGLNPVSGDLVDGDNDPVVATARVVIVTSPQPDYITRLGGAGGPVQTVFCVGDNIFFDDQTPGIGGAAFQFDWEFYDNSTGAGAPLATSTSQNPNFSFSTGGLKLVRLSVTDGNAFGGCVKTIDKLISISPSLVAQISVLDASNNPIVPDFCQNASGAPVSFFGRFADASVGTVTPSTEWRWEFYDENNVLIMSQPAVGFSALPLGPFDRTFINPGIYRVVLTVRDNITACQTTDQVLVRVFEKPLPIFAATNVCAGQNNTFSESSTLNPIAGEVIILREWDFNYDGVTFIKDPAFDNQVNFSRSLGPAGTYQVALRVTASLGGCADMLVQSVTVHPIPISAFSPDVTSGCSILRVNFLNSGVLGQPDVIDRFQWEMDEGAGFIVMGIQQPADPGFTNFFPYDFDNITAVNKIFAVRLRTVTVNGCETLSPVSNITVFPGTNSGFFSPGYSPFNDNCSPQAVDFFVDAGTQSLGPSDYRWQVSDNTGLLSDVSTGTTPTFNFNFINPGSAVKDFFVTLITTLPSGCFGDSTRVIRINPVPSPAFVMDTLIFDCQKMRLRFTAVQSGLPEYHWTISENAVVMVNSTSPASSQEYEVNRPASGVVTIAVDLETRNLANCLSGTSNQAADVPAIDLINSSFTVTPLTQSLPASTVTITNTTNPGPWQTSWDFGDGTTSTAVNPGAHTYATYGTYTISLTVTNNVCVEQQSQTITITAIPAIIDFDFAPGSGCVPLTVTFNNLSQFAEPDTYEWDFGDGQGISTAINPTYTYFEPGTFSVTLTGNNITGQMVSLTQSMVIEAYPLPSAQFDVKPHQLFIPEGILYTSNRSFGATQFMWDFGDGSLSFLPEPQHVYAGEGVYDITLIAYSDQGCTDTLVSQSIVTVRKGGQVLVPNAFSPNLGGSGSGTGDGKNDIFLPLMRGVTEFELLVFNRWGELLFESRDQSIGWDGYYNGKLCPQDVYMYKVTALLESGERVIRVGDINLIR